MFRAMLITLLVAALAAAMGCAKRQLTSLSTDLDVDLVGRWDNMDSKRISAEMIGNCLDSPWAADFSEKAKNKPTVMIGLVQSKSPEVTVETFLGDIETVFLESSDVVLTPERAALTEATAKDRAREVGADYLLDGTINSIEDMDDGERVVFYQVDLMLHDLATNAKVWLGQKRIKKYLDRKKKPA
jgi:hypothetical protein